MDDSGAAPTLRPRDVQARIRAGRSVEEVAAASGMPVDRVQRFAAPVLAEREFIAGQAMAAPVRRHGETSGHRKLRSAIGERLFGLRIDVDEVGWDAARLEDGRWAVKASYRLPDAEQDAEAVFVYDQPGRFSVAGNAQARWLLGETESTEGEPTLRLEGDDDLALMRSVNRSRRSPETPEPAERPTADASQVRTLRAVPGPAPDIAASDMAAPDIDAPADSGDAGEVVGGVQPVSNDASADEAAEAADTETAHTETADTKAPDEGAEDTGGLDVLYDILDRSGTEFTEDSIPLGPLAQPAAAHSLDEAPAEEPPADDVPTEPAPTEQPPTDEPVAAGSAAAHGQTPDRADQTSGVSDAAAVPQTPSRLADDDPIGRATPFRDYPVEPSLFDDEDLGLPAPEPPAPAPKPRRTRKARNEPADHPTPDEDAAHSAAETPATDDPAPENPAPENPAPDVPADDAPAEPDAPKKRSRKRATVPSWDEIMFGSPRNKA